MATINADITRPNGDVIRPITTSTNVLRDDGTTIEAAVKALEDGGGSSITRIYGDVPDNTSNISQTLAVRSYHMGSANMGDGSVLFAGGETGDIRSAYVNKITVDGTRTLLDPLTDGKHSLGSATLGDGSVVFAGGYTGLGSADPTDSVDLYKTDGTHIELEPLSVARGEIGSATLGDGSVVFVGGTTRSYTGNSTTVDRYFLDGVHSTISPIGISGRSVGATFGNGTAIFADYGGNIVVSYQPDGAFTTFESPTYHTIRTASTLGDGSVVFFGFDDSSDPVGEIYRYISDGTLTTRDSIPAYPESSATMGNGTVICCTSEYASVGYLDHMVYQYTVNDDVIIDSPRLGGGWGSGAATLGDGSVLFAGGRSHNLLDPSNVIDSYGSSGASFDIPPGCRYWLDSAPDIKQYTGNTIPFSIPYQDTLNIEYGVTANLSDLIRS